MTGEVLITAEERLAYRKTISLMRQLLAELDEFIRTGAPMQPMFVQICTDMTQLADPQQQYRSIANTLSHVEQTYHEALRHAGQFRLSPFCEFMFPDEPPALHHEFLIDHLEAVHRREILRLAVSLPPGSGKSSYASVRFAAWHLGRRPHDRWLQGAHTFAFVKDRLGKPVRALIGDPRYGSVFPEMGISPSSSASGYFEFTGGGGYWKGIGVGVASAGYRADIGNIDDPLASREDAESPTMRRRLHNWYDDDFSPRPMPGSPILICATRWHEMDLIGFELDKMKRGEGDDWTEINIPAIANDADPLGRSEGDPLWPEMFPKEFYLARKRSMASRSWNSLYMGEPTDEAGGVLKREDVHRYSEMPADVIENGTVLKKVVRRVTLSADCAEKDTERSDFTAVTVWVETYDRHHYLIHAAQKRCEFVEMVSFIETIARAYDVDQMLVEDRGAGTQYIQVRKDSPGPAPVIAIATKQQSKTFRFDGVTPMFASGEVLLPDRGTDWAADVEAQLFAFPNGKKDDYVDSVSQYLNHSRGTSKGRRGVSKIRSSALAQ